MDKRSKVLQMYVSLLLKKWNSMLLINRLKIAPETVYARGT